MSKNNYKINLNYMSNLKEKKAERIREYLRKYRHDHRDKILEYNRTYYAEHKEDIEERQRRYRMIKKECEVCGCIVSKTNFSRHVKMKNHIEAMKIKKTNLNTECHTFVEKDSFMQFSPKVKNNYNNLIFFD